MLSSKLYSGSSKLSDDRVWFEQKMEFMYTRHIMVSACELNQSALDFKGNYYRIRASILEAKRQGASYRVGPELEACGYSCGDHLLELDCLHHTYELMAMLLRDKDLYGILCDVGLYVMHCKVRYNVRALFMDGKLLCIRPKTVLANDSCYHEGRWFTPWKRTEMEDWQIPSVISEACCQVTVPIGVCLMEFRDVCLGFEICEELFVPNTLHQQQVLNGAEIISNGSASHFQRGKITTRLDLVLSATLRCCCAYMYVNSVGCDGDRLYFDGGSFVSSCGRLIGYNQRFDFNADGCSVTSTIIDLDEVKAKRSAIMSWSNVAASSYVFPRVKVNRNLCLHNYYAKSLHSLVPRPDNPILKEGEIDLTTAEILNVPVCWLWDYLVKSRLSGLFLAMSGGADSTASACLIFFMCQKLFSAITSVNTKELIPDAKKGRKSPLKKLRKVLGDPEYFPSSAKDICSRLLVVAYMPSKNSSKASREQFLAVVADIGCTYYEVNIDSICSAVVGGVSAGMKLPQTPKFMTQGGSQLQDCALQNVQARSRMIVSYMVAQMYTDTKVGGNKAPLLVVGCPNAEESVIGYCTKYDCTFADVSLIGSLGKEDVYHILRYFRDVAKFDSVKAVIDATPSAELVPIVEDDHAAVSQSDEADLGITYEQLALMRKIRKNDRCGPFLMFRALCHYYARENVKESITLNEITRIVKLFFLKYGANRHKANVLPPTVHMVSHTAENTRGDFRPIIYIRGWDWQFKQIDELAENFSANRKPLRECARLSDQQAKPKTP